MLQLTKEQETVGAAAKVFHGGPAKDAEDDQHLRK
jgi:hypothetical protein